MQPRHPDPLRPRSRPARGAMAFSSVLALGLAAACFLGAAQRADGGEPRAPERVHGPQDDVLDDLDIRLAIDIELLTDEGVDSRSLDVVLSDGVAELTGTVPDLLSAERAVRIAGSVRGVKSVVDRIEVRPPSVPDGRLAADVTRALALDVTADSYKIAVDVKDLVATLSGTVDSWVERRFAERVAKGVRGVVRVRNDIVVRPRDDRMGQEIAADVHGRFDHDLWLDPRMIDVAVEDGKVTLDGHVGSATEKRRAEELAWVHGVTAVDADGLRVRWWARNKNLRRTPEPVYSDERLERAVKTALRYDPRVLAFQPSIAVDDGVVTLTGSVDSLAAKQAARDTARNTVGVRRVRDLLKVRPPSLTPAATLRGAVEDALVLSPLVDADQIVVTARSGRVYLRGEVGSSYEAELAELAAARVHGVITVVNHLAYPTPKYAKADAEIEADVRQALFWDPFTNALDVRVTVEDGVARLEGEVESIRAAAAAERSAWRAGARAVVNELRYAALAK